MQEFFTNHADGVMVYEEYRQWAVDFRDVNPFGQQPVGGGFGIDIATETLVPLSFEITGQAGAYAIVEDSNGRVWFAGQYLSDAVTGRQIEGVVRFSRTDQEPPVNPAPTGFTSTLHRERVVLRWDAIPGAASYEVTQDGVTLAPSASRWFTARNLDAGTSYDFTVQAVFANGSRSVVAAPLSVTTEGIVADTPTGLRSTLQTRERVVLTWDNMGSGVSYEIRQNGVVVGTQTSRWFTARSLEPNTSFDFTVQATYPNGAVLDETQPVSVSTLP